MASPSIPQTAVIIPISTGWSPDALARDLVLHALAAARSCPTSTASACLRAPLRAARPDTDPAPCAYDSYPSTIVVADHQPDLDARHLVDELRGDIAQRVGDDEHLRVAVVEDVRDLVGVEVRVDAREEQPRPLRRPARLEVLDPVLHQDRDVIPEPQAHVPEQLRELVRTIIQLPVGNALPRSRHHIGEMRRDVRARAYPGHMSSRTADAESVRKS